MPPEVRRAFLIAAGLLVAVALVWASVFESLPPAEFSLQNFSDPKTIDPGRATGDTESRIIFELFDGLLEMLPTGEADPSTGLQPLSPQPAVASSYEISDQGRTYTFHLRNDAKWSDGSPLTSHDFAWSWLRMLHPATACEYSFQLYAIPYAQEFNQATVNVGDRVEIELFDRPGESLRSEPNIQPFPRGTIRYGTLRNIRKPDKPVIRSGMSPSDEESSLLTWQDQWVYDVDVVTTTSDSVIDWDSTTEQQSFTADLSSPLANSDTVKTHGLLVAFDKLGGLETPDDHTFVVHLKDPVPFFLNLVAYYPMFPVNRACVEKHGSPLWTKAENIVSNGPFKLQMRRLRDRVRLIKNEHYYNAHRVALNSIDFLSLEGENSALNMYETDQIQWVTQPPQSLLEVLRDRPDYHSAPKLSIYFYRLNVARPPLDDVRVRRAIAMAIDRIQIVEQVAKGGQSPAYTLIPPGIAGYKSADGFEPDIDEAKRLINEAGYPGGRGLPKLTILYNTSESHRAIAETIQQQLQNNLNLQVDLQNMEWGSFLDKIQQMDYQIARHGWIADYPDPNTFLDLWVTDGPQNSTNWSNRKFDSLIAEASREVDPEMRMQLLKQAEQIFIDELPAIPIYFYTSTNMVKPHIEGLFPTAQDKHPMHLIRLKK